MSDRIAASLRRLFEEHRIVFWYDADRDMRPAFEAVDLPDVTKVEIVGNEFGLKHRMLRQEPEQRFLVYKEDAEPPMKDNWLLDLQLATAVFKADQAAIWLTDLGLPTQMEGVVRDHMEFYRSQGRLEALQRLVAPTDTQSKVRMKMLAVCAGVEGRLDTVIEAMLGELAEEKDDIRRLIERANLLEFFWKQVEQAYGYQSDIPDFEDFAITLFQSAYAHALDETAALNTEAYLVFRRWKNARTSLDAFTTLSERYQELLAIPADLAGRDFRTLVTIDFFEEIDRHIIRGLVEVMATQTVGSAEVLKWVRERRQSHWYGTYKHIYQAIGFATEFQQALAEANLGMSSLAEGVKRYTASWFRLDQLYRKFVFHYVESGQSTLLGALFDAVENRYTNTFVRPVNDAWQDHLTRATAWDVPGYPKQRDFYIDQAAMFRRMDQKVVVIISDALRYEVAEECLRRIRGLNRFDAELKPMIGSLPSYTQLGMAALLPHRALELAPEGDGTVLADGASTVGLQAREKRLATGRQGDRARAMSAEDLMELKGDDAKDLFRDHDIVYVYHNRIDAIGDKRATEDRTFEAVDAAIDDLLKLVRKLTSANFSNVLITADHGFLYQHRPLDDAAFSIADPAGENVALRNRRFVIGNALHDTPGMKKFTSADLGLSGDLDVLIPNSLHRLRVKGAGSRFVHGGAALQEIIVPVIKVGKKRETDVNLVDIQIIVPGRDTITSGQTAVTFYQAEPISEKTQARELLAGIYAADGTPISDEHILTFDFVSSNPREREIPRQFLLSRDAERFNHQDVFLKLREQVGKTSHYTDYASHRFQLRRGIASDFDF